MRYVDDIFCVIKTPVIDDFLHHINGISPSIKFTVEIEENRFLAFLDVRVSRSSDNTLWTRDVEAVYLQTASASTSVASASKQIHRNFASKMPPVRW